MTDLNNKEIKVGDLIKRCGYVTYADGPRFKYSKKTWLVSKIDSCNKCDGECQHPYYKDENGNDMKLGAKEGIQYVVVGNEENGLDKEYEPVDDVIKIGVGSVESNYEVLKDIKKRNWFKGDIVKIIGNVAFESLEQGYLKEVSLNIPHKHILIVADNIKVGAVARELKVNKKNK